MSADLETEFKVVVIGGGNVGRKALVTSMLSKLDNVVVVDNPVVYEIKPHPLLPEIKKVEHGSYRQFEKRDKRKNFRN